MDCIDNDLDWNAEPMAIDLAESNTYQTACGKCWGFIFPF
jgi:hypothetical protein